MSTEEDAFNPLANYQHVEEFEPDVEEEYEEEETLYFTLDLGQLDPNLLPNATSYKLIGLETSTPFLQIGGSTFKGNYETLLGTEIILQDSPQASTSASYRMLQPLATTSNRIRFSEVRLVPKTFPGEAGTARDMNGSNVVDKNMGRGRGKTLGGVSREKTASFFPVPSKDNAVVLKGAKSKRRWYKRPEGYATDDEDKGEKASGSGKVHATAEKNMGSTDGNEEMEQDSQRMDVQVDEEDES